MVNVDMLEDCVLVEQIESENDASAGGIILPDKINERPIMAKVLAVGPGVKLETGNRFPMTLRQNDIVAFPRKSGDHFLIDGRALIVIPERYVLFRIVSGMRVFPDNVPRDSNGFVINENDDNGCEPEQE